MNFSTVLCVGLVGALLLNFAPSRGGPAPPTVLPVLGPLVGGIAGLCGLSMALSVGSRPELWTVGPRLLTGSAVASLGTASSALALGLSLYLAFLVSARLASSGEASAWAQLGRGRWATFVSLAPWWLLLVTLAALAAFVAEPAGWLAVHRVRGSPLRSAVAWAELEQGRALVLRDGSALLRDPDTGLLVGVEPDGAWTVRAEGFAPHPEGAGWMLSGVRLSTATGNWTASELAVQREGQRADGSWPEPKTPRAAGTRELLRRISGDGGRTAVQGVERDRSLLVLHRRLATPGLTLLLAWLGWCLGWTPAGRRTGRWVQSASIVGLGCLWFLLERGLDRATAEGMLPGPVAGWLPVLCFGCLVGLVSGRSDVPFAGGDGE